MQTESRNNIFWTIINRRYFLGESESLEKTLTRSLTDPNLDSFTRYFSGAGGSLEVGIVRKLGRPTGRNFGNESDQLTDSPFLGEDCVELVPDFCHGDFAEPFSLLEIEEMLPDFGYCREIFAKVV